MNAQWAGAAVPDVIDFREGPGIMARDFRGTGVPLVRLAGLSASSVLEGCNYLDPEAVEKRWSQFRLEPGDTVISTSASLGRIARVGLEARGAIPYTGIIRMRPRDGHLLADFLPYLLRGPDFQRQAEAMGAGSVMRHFGPSHLRAMTVVVPPLLEQHRITAVLRAHDDKIESSRRLARRLEMIAQAEFRARFLGLLRHDKVRAREQREPCDREGLLSDLADVARRTVQPAEAPDEAFEHFSIPAFDASDGPEVVEGSEMLSGKYWLPETDCVLLSKLNPATRRVWWPRPTGVGTPVCSSEFLVLLPKPGIPNSYLYGVASWDNRFYAELLGQVSGTTGSRQRVRPADVMTCPVRLPSTSALEAWDRFARPLCDYAHRLEAESRTLAKIRDALLPKLVSGQIRVPDTTDPEEAVGPAAEELVA